MTVVARRLFGARGFVLLVVALALAWPAPPRASTPVPQKGGNKTVFAIAIDADNKPVTDLTKEECGLREDGADRPLVEFKPATDPLDVMLVIDTSASIKDSINDVREALGSFGRALMDANPGANVSIMNVAGAALMVAENKKTKEDVEKLLSKTIWGESSNVVLLEGIVDAAKRLEKSPSPRRAMIIIHMDGMPEGSSVPPAKVMQQVISSGASVWVASYSTAFSTRTVAKNGPQGPQRELFLSRAPQGTGGVRLKSDDVKVLGGALVQIAKAVASQYVVTYTRPDGPMPKQLQMAQVRSGVNLLYPQTPPK